MYSVIVNQNPELAARQAVADAHHSPHTSQLPKPHVSKPSNYVSPNTAFMLTPVTVESIAYKHAKGIVAKNDVMAKKLQAIIDRGPTYQSIRLFHLLAS